MREKDEMKRRQKRNGNKNWKATEKRMGDENKGGCRSRDKIEVMEETRVKNIQERKEGEERYGKEREQNKETKRKESTGQENKIKGREEKK